MLVVAVAVARRSPVTPVTVVVQKSGGLAIVVAFMGVVRRALPTLANFVWGIRGIGRCRGRVEIELD